MLETDEYLNNEFSGRDTRRSDPVEEPSQGQSCANARKKKMAADVTALLGSRVTVFFLGIVFQLLTRRLLGPALIGVWNLVQVVRDQVFSLSLGVAAGADRQLPILAGRGEFDRQERLRSATFSYLILEGVVLGVAFLAYWRLARAGYSSTVRAGLLIIPALVILGRVELFYRVSITTMKEFRLVAWTDVVFYLTDMLLLVYFLVAGIYGLFLGLVVNAALRLAVYALAVRSRGLFRLRWFLDLREIRSLLPYGLPMALYGILGTMLARADALLVSAYLGTTALGYYFFGPQLALSISRFPKVLTAVVWPHQLESYGRGGIESLRAPTRNYLELTLFIMAPLTVSAAFFGIQPVVRFMIPKFEPGLAAIQVSILSVIGITAGIIVTQVLLARARVWTVIGIELAAVVLLIVSIFIARVGELTLTGVAWSVVSARLAQLGLTLFAAYHIMGVGALEGINEWGPGLTAGFLWTAAIPLVDAGVSNVGLGVGVWSEVGSLMLKETIFLLIVSFVLLKFRRRLLSQAVGLLWPYQRGAVSRKN